MSKFKFFDVQDRKKLNEGRSQGLGYAFCQLRNENEIHTIAPISACKDYLSDVVYTERTGRDYEAYGLATTKLGLFEDGKPGYIVMRILPYGTIQQIRYPAFPAEQAQLKANHQKMAGFINHYERLLKLPSLTTSEELADGTYLLILPNYWTQYVYLISLWSLYVRVAMTWDGGVRPDEFLKTVKGDDFYYVKTAMPKMARLIKDGYASHQDMTAPGFHPHSFGINGYSFPS